MLVRAIRMLVASAVVCAGLAVCSPGGAMAADRLTEGIAAQSAREWGTAEKALRKAVEEDPGPDSFKALGHYLFYTGRPGEGLALYRKSLEKDSDDPEAFAGEAECLGDLGRYQQAMDASERAIGRYGKDGKLSRKILARYYLVLAGAQGEAAQKEGVMAMIKYAFSVKKNIDRALELDPTYARAVYGLGVYYKDAPSVVGGDPSKGLSMLDKARRLDPGDYGIQLVWIGALAEAGRKDEARRELEKYRQTFAGVTAAFKDLDAVTSKMK